MREQALGPREKQLLDHLTEQIVGCNSDATGEAAREILAAGIDPAVAMRIALGKAAETVGERFESGEYFLAHLVMAGEAMTVAGDVLQAALPKESTAQKKVVVIGTVEADLHSVGKNIVGMMLKASGFEVHDLGVDVKSETIISKAKEVNADIIALSSLLTTTMPYQREVIDDLKAAGLRNHLKVMVGGGPVTKEWAERIGADGHGIDAIDAVRIAKQLTGLE